MGILSSLFGIGNKTEKIQEYLNDGAMIVDVRTKEEYRMGNIKKSENFPLQLIEGKIPKLKKSNTKIITCCQSGARSSAAAAVLKRNGIDAVNGGSWNSLQSIMKG
ncbi:MAG: phage shock protein E [Granulosicoccus sp.]|jgi:phage shock protein E